MDIIIAIYIFIIGTIMGSFFNVVAHRLSNNESIIKPGSHCENCNHLLKWYELIPIISFLIQGGRCRQCHTKLSWWYPLIEIITGLFYLFSYLYFGLSYDFFISLVISSVLVITCITDFNYLIILDEPLIVGSILIIIIKFLQGGIIDTLIAILSGLLLFFFMLLVKILGDKAFKRESLGGGDIKLSFFIGLSLGYKLAFVNLVLASLLTLPIAFYYLIKYRDREVPFGPFLIISNFIIFVFASPILEFIDYLIMF
mgnify:FL=1